MLLPRAAPQRGPSPGGWRLVGLVLPVEALPVAQLQHALLRPWRLLGVWPRRVAHRDERLPGAPGLLAARPQRGLLRPWQLLGVWPRCVVSPAALLLRAAPLGAVLPVAASRLAVTQVGRPLAGLPLCGLLRLWQQLGGWPRRVVRPAVLLPDAMPPGARLLVAGARVPGLLAVPGQGSAARPGCRFEGGVPVGSRAPRVGRWRLAPASVLVAVGCWELELLALVLAVAAGRLVRLPQEQVQVPSSGRQQAPNRP